MGGLGFWGRWGRNFLLLFMGIVGEMNYDYGRVDIDVVVVSR